MPPTTTPSRHRARRRPLTFIAMLAALAAASLGLAACGGSSTTTTTVQRSANAAATGTTTGGSATAEASTTTTGTTSTGKSTSATGTGTGTTPSPANAPRITEIRSCLAKKGITIPQSHPLADAKLPSGMSRSKFYEELRGCAGGLVGPHNPNSFKGAGRKGFHNPFNSPRFHTVLARFAACLRQQGVNVGEPNTSGKGPIFNTKGLNTGSPKFKAATAKCRSTLLHALRPTKAHPGTSGGK